MRMLEPVPIDAIPKPRTQETGSTPVADPRAHLAGTDLLPTNARAPPSDREKSSVRPIALQVAQELVDRHHRLARWRRRAGGAGKPANDGKAIADERG